MNSGLGHIGNQDTIQMNTQQKRFLYFRRFFIEKARNIANTLATLDYLSSHQDEFSILSKAAPGFIRAVHNNFWAQAIIDLDAFFVDSKKRNKILSFYRFFNYIKANWNLICLKEFEVYVVRENAFQTEKIKVDYNYVLNMITECEKIIVQNQNTLHILKKFRDNVFAHYGDRSKQKEKILISIDTLKAILEIVEKIINKIEVLYDRTETAIYCAPISDIAEICYRVKKYQEYRLQIRGWDFEKELQKRGNQ